VGESSEHAIPSAAQNIAADSNHRRGLMSAIAPPRDPAINQTIVQGDEGVADTYV
jgi:hypothetical protein